MLDEKEEELLERTLKVEQENNAMLKKMYHSMWWGRIFNILYWAAILGLMAGSYYYAQPYIAKLVEMFDKVSGALKGL